MKNKRISLHTILTTVFIILKLTNNLDWNWLLILSPTIFIIVLWMLMTLFLDLVRQINEKGLLNTILRFL